MKIAIVIGHNSRAQGAVRVTDGRTEYDWNGQLAEIIKSHDPSSVKIFRRDPSAGGYSAEIRKVYGQVDAWGADVSVELHFNGAVDPRATGCLTLSSGSSGSLRLAGEIHKRMLAAMGNEDDGIRSIGPGGRGGKSLHTGRAPAVLTEPYFGGNSKFCHVADANMDELAEAIFEGCLAYLGVEPEPVEKTQPEAGPSPIQVARWRLAEIVETASAALDELPKE